MVPKDWEKKVMERYHNHIREGQPGEARTAEKIQRTYYFPRMTRKIRKYIRGCEACQKNKITYQKPKEQTQLGNITPIRPWQHITTDFVDMPATKGIGNTGLFDEILVVVDRFSKQTILIPTRKKATTGEIFHLLWERVLAIFGIPEAMTSDRDKIFRTEKWQKLMKGMGARKLGPFLIKKKLDFDNYELKLPSRMEIYPVFHISLLDKTENAETMENIEALDEEFEVEKIIDKRVRNGKTEYRVRWNCPEKVQEFESMS